MDDMILPTDENGKLDEEAYVAAILEADDEGEEQYIEAATQGQSPRLPGPIEEVYRRMGWEDDIPTNRG